MLLHFDVQYEVCYWFEYFTGEWQTQRTWYNQEIRTGRDWCYDNSLCGWRSWNSYWSLIKCIAVEKQNQNANYVVSLTLVLSRFNNICKSEKFVNHITMRQCYILMKWWYQFCFWRSRWITFVQCYLLETVIYIYIHICRCTRDTLSWLRANQTFHTLKFMPKEVAGNTI